MKGKKILSLVLAIAMVLGTMGTVAFAEETVVAKIGETEYTTLEKALTAAKDGETIELISGETPISAAGAVYGNKTVTITGSAVFDWSKGWLFVGRGGEGDGTLIFENATITSNEASLANGSYGIHVSAPEAGSDSKNTGSVIFKNSDIQLSYLANRSQTIVDGGKLYVHYGFWVGGRPAAETPDGNDGVAQMDIVNGAIVEVANHNGMGIGHESKGILNVTDSTFNYTGTSIVVKDGSEVNVGGTSTLKMETIDGKVTIEAADDTVIRDSIIDATVFANGDITFEGENKVTSFNPGWYNHTITIGDGDSLEISGTGRMTVGYGNTFNIEGNIADAKLMTVSETVPSLSIPAGMSITGGNGATFNVKNAWVEIGLSTSKNSAANGTFTFDINNSIFDCTNNFGFVPSTTDGLVPVFNFALKNGRHKGVTLRAFN